MDRNYIVYKCAQCGCVFIIPMEYVTYKSDYMTCPLHGKHKDILVVGAYDDLLECMSNRIYHRDKAGVIHQDD